MTNERVAARLASAGFARFVDDDLNRDVRAFAQRLAEEVRQRDPGVARSAPAHRNQVYRLAGAFRAGGVEYAGRLARVRADREKHRDPKSAMSHFWVNLLQLLRMDPSKESEQLNVHRLAERLLGSWQIELATDKERKEARLFIANSLLDALVERFTSTYLFTISGQGPT